MKRIFVTLATASALASCSVSGGNPLIGTTDDGTTTDTGTATAADNSALTKNLSSITVPDGSQVLVNIASLDGTPLEATFVRRTDLDTAGYEAYAIQEDPLDRLFIALTKTANDNASRAAVVQDGGQFNRYLDGGYYEQTGPYTAPDPNSTTAGTGQVSYAGTYAGFTNIATASGAGLLAIPGTVDPTTLPDLPAEAFRISALAFLNANFADNVVNGEIYNRDMIDPSDLSVVTRYPNISLIVTDIDADGGFLGTAEIENDVGVTSGSYGGVFGGTGATSVSGILALTNFDNDIDDEEEIGIFVLTKCGATGDSALCDAVQP